MCTLHTAVKHSPAFSVFHFAPSMKRKRCRRSSRSHASYRYTAVITEYTRNICHRRCIIIAVSTMTAKHISRIRKQILCFRRTICHSEIRISLQCPVAGFETFRPADLLLLNFSLQNQLPGGFLSCLPFARSYPHNNILLPLNPRFYS